MMTNGSTSEGGANTAPMLRAACTLRRHRGLRSATAAPTDFSASIAASRLIRALLVLAVALSPSVAWGGGGGGATYVYDENGRLAAVIKPAVFQPNARLYNYDGAGNLAAITQQDSSQVSVITFTPTCGTAGS